MSSFKWKRYSISPKDYKSLMTGATLSKDSKKVKAYKQASNIRKFEIDLFWKRATFFWAFITAIYVAYYHVLTEICVQECNGIKRYCHGAFPLLILSALGLFFCFSWLLSSIGSKHWQENWENHLDLLEDKITGPLYKTYESGKAYSESKITIAAGWVVTVCSYGLLVYEFAYMLLNKTKLASQFYVFCITLAFTIIVAVLLFAYSVLMRGNTSNDGEFNFQMKVYEEMRNE